MTGSTRFELFPDDGAAEFIGVDHRLLTVGRGMGPDATVAFLGDAPAER